MLRPAPCEGMRSPSPTSPGQPPRGGRPRRRSSGGGDDRMSPGTPRGPRQSPRFPSASRTTSEPQKVSRATPPAQWERGGWSEPRAC